MKKIKFLTFRILPDVAVERDHLHLLAPNNSPSLWWLMSAIHEQSREISTLYLASA